MADYEAIVVGGGHAGIEAALSLARIGFSTLMVTQNLDSIGRLSCNPAIGGLSKGNIVREIDALGGEMAKLIDKTMIQFRMLNRSRGPAVQAPRAQADKFAYNQLAKETLEKQTGLHLFQDTVVDLLLEPVSVSNASSDAEKQNCPYHYCIAGVKTERGIKITAKVVVLTTGTFLAGKIYIGEYQADCGRLGEPAVMGLGKALSSYGFKLGRLKTGTPARVSARSLDYSRMDFQPGDQPMGAFSYSNTIGTVDRLSSPCYITYTNPKTHTVISENMARSPLYAGDITGIGPRYCPSIEDKVVRFPDRQRHQIFAEPEGANTDEVYLNGISTSLPEDVQELFIHTIKGLEEAVIMRPGYAVEYDFINPTQLYPWLETKLVAGLFTAGQTNGTSGYEEAAGQGLLAGINASLKLLKRGPFVLSRAEAYIGVLIDDLVTLGTNEPYRMFTSRAEYRLNLRHDTADVRLLPKGFSVGLQSEAAYEALERKIDTINDIKQLLERRHLNEQDCKYLQSKGPPQANLKDSKNDTGSYNDIHGNIQGEKIFLKHIGKSFSQLVRMPETHLSDLLPLEAALAEYPKNLLEQAELDIKYEGYIRRQNDQIERFKRMEKIVIPPNFDYEKVEGISSEAKEKLKKVRPLSVGQASRISGVRSSDIAVLLIYLPSRKAHNG